MLTPKAHYLNNKNLLEEIHRSKCTYSSFRSKEYSHYDKIVRDKTHITPELIEEVRVKKAQTILQQKVAELKATGLKTSQINLEPIDPLTIPIEHLIFRVMTYEHIPLLPVEELKNVKSEKDKYIKCNFPPWQHVIMNPYGELEIVGKSHWRDGVENGCFDLSHGHTTNRLAIMYMTLVDKLGQKGNWRGYSYLDEMKSQALLQLSQRGLYFDESQSDNPFAYYTTIVKNSFTRILNVERKNQSMRDDLLIMSGATPSHTRQVENELTFKDAADIKVTKDSLGSE
jgi:hypothetical protein